MTETAELTDPNVRVAVFKPPHHSSLEETDIPHEIPTSSNVSWLIIPSADRYSEQDLPNIVEIVKETDKLLNLYLWKVIDQEKSVVSFAYRVLNMGSDLGVYKMLAEQLNVFMVNYDSTYLQYYTHLCQTLPTYGDFAVASGQPTEEISSKIRDNLYAGGMNLKGQYALVKDINYFICDQLSVIYEFEERQPTWMELVNMEIGKLRKLADMIIQIKTHLHYLIIGDLSHAEAIHDITLFLNQSKI